MARSKQNPRAAKTACICHMYSVRISAQVDFVMVSLTAAKHNAKKLFRIDNKAGFR
jgi:hypothetical protein